MKNCYFVSFIFLISIFFLINVVCGIEFAIWYYFSENIQVVNFLEVCG